MKFQIRFTPSAEKDIAYFEAHKQRILIAGIRRYLSEDANVLTKHKKELRPNKLAPWSLKLGDYRIFYEVEEDIVKIIAVGYKEHNDLYIRGKRAIL